MQEMKELFGEKEWSLIQDVTTNGRTTSWLELARKHSIREEGTNDQRRKSANDIFRKYIRKQEDTIKQPKVLIYDIETARMTANLWWSGQQYVNGAQITSDPSIITVSFKWLGSDKISYLKWDKKKSDKKLITEFLKYYNEADIVIGFNNDKFDNRYVNSRALKYGLDVNVHVKSFDLMKQAKRLFRLPSYSMNYIANYVGVETKLQHSGLSMWEHIQFGTKKQAKKAMKKMVEYNIQDIIVTEQVYLRLLKYMKSPLHVGVFKGKGKCTCPTCGSDKVKLYKTTYTTSGSVQHIMKCLEDGSSFKVSNSVYLKSLVNA